MLCYYIDHEVLSPFGIAQLKTSMKEELLNVDEQREAFLSTCHRLELYTDSVARQSAFTQAIGVQPHIDQNVPQRLEDIASGRKSQLLGERAIYFQVENSFAKLPVENPYYHIGDTALSRAKAFREKHDFYAEYDYEDIVFNLLPSMDTLIVVGSGMLGQMIAKASHERGTERTILVTRNPKKSKKRLISTRFQEIYSFGSLPADATQLPFTCLIATDQVNDDYRSKILALVNHEKNELTVNLSALPFTDGIFKRDRYVTMYDDPYLDEVNRSNSLTRSKMKISCH